MGTINMSMTRFCDDALTITRLSSPARSLARLTGGSYKAAYSVLKPRQDALDAELRNFLEQVWSRPCAKNCEQCQLASLHMRRAFIRSRVSAFVTGSLACGGYPWFKTLTFPSYAPRREFVDDYLSDTNRAAFRSLYIGTEARRRVDSLIECIKKWFEDDTVNTRLLRSVCSLEKLLDYSPSLALSLSAAVIHLREAEERAEAFASVSDTRDPYYRQLQDAVYARRGELWKLESVNAVHSDVLEEQTAEVRSEMDASPDDFETMWKTECFKRGWLQATYSVQDDRHPLFGQTFYQRDEAVTKGRNYVDFELPGNLSRSWQRVHEDTPVFRPTPKMGWLMFKQYRDRCYKADDVRTSYYGVQEFGSHGDNCHFHLCEHHDAAVDSARLQRVHARRWHAVSGNRIWKPHRFSAAHSESGVRRIRISPATDGTGRWFEPVQKLEAAGSYIAKYYAKEGGRIVTSQGMDLARFVKEQSLIARDLVPVQVPQEPAFVPRDGGGIKYVRRLDETVLDNSGATAWVGFDYVPGNTRGNVFAGPQLKLVWTAVSSSRSSSVRNARGLRVRLADGTNLSAGAAVPAAGYSAVCSKLDVPDSIRRKYVKFFVDISRSFQTLLDEFEGSAAAKSAFHSKLASSYINAQTAFEGQVASIGFSELPEVFPLSESDTRVSPYELNRRFIDWVRRDTEHYRAACPRGP